MLPRRAVQTVKMVLIKKYTLTVGQAVELLVDTDGCLEALNDGFDEAAIAEFVGMVNCFAKTKLYTETSK